MPRIRIIASFLTGVALLTAFAAQTSFAAVPGKGLNRLRAAAASRTSGKGSEALGKEGMKPLPRFRTSIVAKTAQNPFPKKPGPTFDPLKIEKEGAQSGGSAGPSAPAASQQPKSGSFFRRVTERTMDEASHTFDRFKTTNNVSQESPVSGESLSTDSEITAEGIAGHARSAQYVLPNGATMPSGEEHEGSGEYTDFGEPQSPETDITVEVPSEEHRSSSDLPNNPSGMTEYSTFEGSYTAAADPQTAQEPTQPNIEITAHGEAGHPGHAERVSHDSNTSSEAHEGSGSYEDSQGPQSSTETVKIEYEMPTERHERASRRPEPNRNAFDYSKVYEGSFAVKVDPKSEFESSSRKASTREELRERDRDREKLPEDPPPVSKSQVDSTPSRESSYDPKGREIDRQPTKDTAHQKQPYERPEWDQVRHPHNPHDPQQEPKQPEKNNGDGSSQNESKEQPHKDPVNPTESAPSDDALQHMTAPSAQQNLPVTAPQQVNNLSGKDPVRMHEKEKQKDEKPAAAQPQHGPDAGQGPAGEQGMPNSAPDDRSGYDGTDGYPYPSHPGHVSASGRHPLAQDNVTTGEYRAVRPAAGVLLYPWLIKDAEPLGHNYPVAATALHLEEPTAELRQNAVPTSQQSVSSPTQPQAGSVVAAGWQSYVLGAFCVLLYSMSLGLASVPLMLRGIRARSVTP